MMPSPDSKRRLTILHTNDFHNQLSSAHINRIAQLYARTSDPKLLLDAGDAGGSTNITFHFDGEPILDEMSRLGYSAMTVGNRDFHVSRLGFRAKLGRAQFPILCANIRPSANSSSETSTQDEHPLSSSKSEHEPRLRSYLLLVTGDWRVLIFGLTVPMVTERMWERKLSAYIFDTPVPSAVRLLPALRNRLNPDLTVALTHIGLRLDRELAARLPEIDLVIGGHSHELLPQGERVGETLIVQAGSHGRYIGIVDVDPNSDAAGRPHLSARVEGL
jgi:5'-nucleotidase/UDP-sugar diphosphatase